MAMTERIDPDCSWASREIEIKRESWATNVGWSARAIPPHLLRCSSNQSKGWVRSAIPSSGEDRWDVACGCSHESASFTGGGGSHRGHGTRVISVRRKSNIGGGAHHRGKQRNRPFMTWLTPAPLVTVTLTYHGGPTMIVVSRPETSRLAR